MNLTLRRALGFAAGALVAASLGATTVVDKSHDTMAREAALIATGQCTQLASAWLGRQLVTVATVRVDERLKGLSSSEIQVIIPGGIDVNRPIPIAMTVPGAPQIVPHESVLLFLAEETRVPNGYAIVGFAQGKFSLVEEAGGRKVVRQNLTALNLAKAAGSHPGTAQAFPLEQLRQEIHDALATPQ
jgi:hypothetical protein